MAVNLMGVSQYALAEENQQADEESIEKIIVTGSRIARQGITASSPVSVLSAEAIEGIGITRLEDLTSSFASSFCWSELYGSKWCIRHSNR